jgi:hypothetical protein
MSCDRHVKKRRRFDVSSAAPPTRRLTGGERALWVGAENRLQFPSLLVVSDCKRFGRHFWHKSRRATVM